MNKELVITKFIKSINWNKKEVNHFELQ
jgi:hypothetical protein